MTREEKRALKETLKAWHGYCCDAGGRAGLPPCCALCRSHCLSRLDALVALVDRAPLVDDVAAARSV